MNTFATRAFAALTEGKKQFGSYAYHDKGADEIMDLNTFILEIKTMPVAKAGKALTELEALEDTYMLLSGIILGLDEWAGFDQLLEDFPNLQEYY